MSDNDKHTLRDLIERAVSEGLTAELVLHPTIKAYAHLYGRLSVSHAGDALVQELRLQQFKIEGRPGY